MKSCERGKQSCERGKKGVERERFCTLDLTVQVENFQLGPTASFCQSLQSCVCHRIRQSYTRSQNSKDIELLCNTNRIVWCGLGKGQNAQDSRMRLREERQGPQPALARREKAVFEILDENKSVSRCQDTTPVGKGRDCDSPNQFKGHVSLVCVCPQVGNM